MVDRYFQLEDSQTNVKTKIARGRTTFLMITYIILVTFAILAFFTGCSGPAKEVNIEQKDYLSTVKAYADTLLEHGRDRYGKVESPLIAATLDRKRYRLFEGAQLGRIQSIPRDEWDIRTHDRTLTGANPMHDENLYQVLYALTQITGEKRYAQEADKALKWFFENCQSEGTGLLAWGEHIGWDFNTEKNTSNTHEYFRPWVLWEESFKLAPKACRRFALGVWEHQIYDHETGIFSRHAGYVSHEPGKDFEFPRHGGFYIATWAQAYRHTQDSIFLRAIETLVDSFEGRRSKISGGLPAENHGRYKGKMLWPDSNLSLAIDLWDSAEYVPAELAAKMRESASKTDRIFLSLKHDLSTNGEGFVVAAHTDTLQVSDVRYHRRCYTLPWTSGYSQNTDAMFANLCMLRYRQVGLDGYRKLILGALQRYMTTGPDIDFPVHPGTLGDVIFLMLAGREITGEQRYLDRADHFANKAIGLFLSDSTLPAASSKHNHYEAITRGDTLMMALLKLWAVKSCPAVELNLIYNDR